MPHWPGESKSIVHYPHSPASLSCIRPSSIVLSQSSLPSSCSSSVFPFSNSGTGSTAPTSHAPSECEEYGVQYDSLDPSNVSLILRSAQLRRHTTAVAKSPGPPAQNSRVHHSSGPSSRPSTPLAQDWEFDEDHSLPSHPVQLHRTDTFDQLPSSLPRSHSIMAINTSRRALSTSDIDPDMLVVIDEASLSKDNHFAEAVLHDQGECLCYFSR